MPMSMPTGFRGWADPNSIERAAKWVFQGRLDLGELPRSIRSQVEMRLPALQAAADEEEAARKRVEKRKKAGAK